MEIKSIIEARIREAGITKKELATRIGAHAGSLNSMLESPSWPTLDRVAHALNLTVAQLVSDTDAITPVATDQSTIICPDCGRRIALKVE